MTNTELGSSLGDDPANRPDTLERLLAHYAAVFSDKVALIDPTNRNSLEGRSDNLPLRTYTYKALEVAVNRLATRLSAVGLTRGDYVALQMPNFCETPILVLGLMRAGLVPCLLPLSWSNDDISHSFQRLKPKALISCGQLNGVNYSENMRELAFAHMHVRFVMGVGYDIAEGVSDITPLFDPNENFDHAPYIAPPFDSALSDLGLVTYIDPVTPVPHNSGQILSSGLLHVLELQLSANDHILSAYPLSSIPGLAAHFYPWLMSGSCMTLHQPFDFGVLQEQMRANSFSYFAAPEQVIDYLLRNDLPVPQKLATVRRDSHLPTCNPDVLPSLDLYDLWNLGGLGSVPVKYQGFDPAGLFEDGRICLASATHQQLCLAGAQIINDRLHVKGRIFPDVSSLKTSMEWISLKKRFDDGWLDTGLIAFAGPDNSVLLGGKPVEELQKVAS
ncbi:MAG: acyl--CoA ligase [bacterium]|nr:acyl--CoA ligase [bacterium]